LRYRGKIRVDARTKNLLPSLEPGSIAVIAHEDLDETSVQGLINARVRAVVNACSTVSGRYPNQAPLRLVRMGIPVLDNVGLEVLSRVKDGQWGELCGGEFVVDSRIVARGSLLDETIIRDKIKAGRANYNRLLAEFAANTISHAGEELNQVLDGFPVPALNISFHGRPALVVVRGRDYRQDLLAIRHFIVNEKPVLIGVDGGADALLDFGFKPDLIIGDMDSVSDRALKSGSCRIVHAYPDGRAPGLKRVTELNLNSLVLPATGTSEDVAMLLAYQLGASLIVAVGTHSSMLDFLEKGRRGMASTFLVRLKVGEILVDAKGVSRLYRPRPRSSQVLGIVLAAALPLILVFIAFPPGYHLVRLFWLRLRLAVGF